MSKAITKLATIAALIVVAESMPTRSQEKKPFVDQHGHEWSEGDVYKTRTIMNEVNFFKTEWEMQHFFKKVAKRATTFTIYQRIKDDIRMLDMVRTDYTFK